MATFDITRPTDAIRLDEQRSATTPFAVSNLSSRTIRARFEVLPAVPDDRALYAIAAEGERVLRPNETHTVRVQITAPQATPPGVHTFRLKVVDEEAPDEHFAESQAVEFNVPVITPPKLRFWWLIPVAILVLAIAAVVWLTTRDPGDPNTITIEAGYASPEFRTRGTDTAVLENARVLVFGRELATLAHLMPVLEQVAAANDRRGIPLLIAVPSIAEDPLGVLVKNQQAKLLNVVVSVVKGSAAEQEEALQRLATFTGTTVLPNDTAVENAKIEALGSATRIRVSAESTAVTVARRPSGDSR